MLRVERLKKREEIQDAINCGICLMIFIVGMIFYLVKMGVKV